MSASTDDLMLEIIKKNSPDLGWVGSKFESFKHLGGTNKGEIGEDFIFQYMRLLGHKPTRSSIRSDEYDGFIDGFPYEVKTASLGLAGTFQFNHVRLDHNYRILICLGVEPNRLVFEAWTKEQAMQRLEAAVGMARNQDTTRKVTLQARQMLMIDRFDARLRDLLTILSAN